MLTQCSNVLKGGWGGLIGGTALSTGILWTLGRRFPAIRHLNPSFHAFLVTGTGSFAGIKHPHPSQALTLSLISNSNHLRRPLLAQLRSNTQPRQCIHFLSNPPQETIANCKTTISTCLRMGSAKPLSHCAELMGCIYGSRSGLDQPQTFPQSSSEARAG